MKTIFKPIVLVILIQVVVGACTKKKQNCIDGYTGNNCEYAVNNNFVGNWSGDQSCTQIPFTSYRLSVVRDTLNPYRFTLSGINNNALTLVTCLIDKTNTTKFTGARQSFVAQVNEIEIEEGSINGESNSVFIRFSIYVGNTKTNSCTFSGRLN